MIRRLLTEQDAEEANAICNDPHVRAQMITGMIHHDHDWYWDEIVKNPIHYVLVENGFCAVFAWSAPGVYECHIMAMKQARGANLFASGKRMLAYMKNEGARMVWGQPNIYNRAAICYIRRMGLKPVGFYDHPVAGEVQYFVTEDL